MPTIYYHMLLYIYIYVQAMFVLGLKDAHSSNYNTFQGRAAYIKGCYSQDVCRCLRRISHDVFKETMYKLKNIFDMLIMWVKQCHKSSPKSL